MSVIDETKVCYFCDEPYPVHIAYINKYNENWVCHHCVFIVSINNNRENGECCICLENKNLINLPTCTHKLCIACCKTVYFGTTENNRPIHFKEIYDEQPIFPYENDDDDSKQEEYFDFEDLHFNYERNYEELIIIRNELITRRPEWMNTQDFINYENENIKYQIKQLNVEKEYDKWNETKTIGNRKCPLCRANPL